MPAKHMEVVKRGLLWDIGHKEKVKGGNMKRAYAEIPEGQIHYRIEGEGEPLLLLHAAVASSNEFAKVIPFLSKTIVPLPWII